ncbi:MAG: FAD-dependent oxidoreductase [Methanomicrobiales archaeon]|nr:FAD-dependent oxidoreductase [Methanomicrobiales archaeon]
MPPVKVYSTKACPYCRLVKAFLEKHGIEYKDIDVGADKEAAREMVRISGQYSVPVTVADEQIIVGFDTARLIALFGTKQADETYDVLIAGAGPGGLTAAVYTARKLLKTIVVTENIGGQALESWAIENYMGYRMVSGEALMQKFEEQAKQLQIHVELDRIQNITKEGDEFVVKTASEQTFRALSLIICTGRKPKWLGLPEEPKYLGHGLSVCATCDAPLYREKDVAVVGGGNSAVTTAIELGSIARSVHLIVRSQCRADATYMKILENKGNITMHLGYEVTALQGNGYLSGITIKNRETGAEENIAVHGVFLEIGQRPNTDFLAGFLQTDANGEIPVDCNCHTSIDGVFAAGDVTTIKGKQIIIAAGEGAKAALEVHEYLVKRK